MWVDKEVAQLEDTVAKKRATLDDIRGQLEGLEQELDSLTQVRSRAVSMVSRTAGGELRKSVREEEN